MKSRLVSLLGFLALLLVIFGCGGGGVTGATVRATGRVLNIESGGPFGQIATVQTSAQVASTSTADGSFSVNASSGSSVLTVIPPAATGFPVFDFTFSPFNLAVTDVGDLWVGPQKVIVTGRLRNSATNAAIAGGTVRFAGRSGFTDANGNFTLADVAYSSTSTASFLGLVGRADATTYFSNEFTTNGNTSVGGVVNVGDIFMTPLDGDTPPGLPYTIWGRITPAISAPNTLVTLKDSVGTVIRRFTVGSDGRYQFWVPTGNYSVEFQNGTLTAPAQNVTLTNTTDVVRADATLN